LQNKHIFKRFYHPVNEIEKNKHSMKSNYHHKIYFDKNKKKYKEKIEVNDLKVFFAEIKKK
jgi:N-acetylneuraminic acid mutarotase